MIATAKFQIALLAACLLTLFVTGCSGEKKQYLGWSDVGGREVKFSMDVEAQLEADPQDPTGRKTVVVAFAGRRLGFQDSRIVLDGQELAKLSPRWFNAQREAAAWCPARWDL